MCAPCRGSKRPDFSHQNVVLQRIKNTVPNLSNPTHQAPNGVTHPVQVMNLSMIDPNQLQALGAFFTTNP